MKEARSPLTASEISELVRCLAKAGLGRLEIDRGGFRLRLSVCSTGDQKVLPAQAQERAMARSTTDAIRSPAIGRLHLGHSGPLGRALSSGDAFASNQIVAVLEAGELLLPVVAKSAGRIERWIAQEGTLLGVGAPVAAVTALPR